MVAAIGLVQATAVVPDVRTGVTSVKILHASESYMMSEYKIVDGTVLATRKLHHSF